MSKLLRNGTEKDTLPILSKAASAARTIESKNAMPARSVKRQRHTEFTEEQPSNDSFSMQGIVDEYSEAPMTYDSMASVDSFTGRRRLGDRKNYRCGRCNKPKKGHVCPYMMRIKKKVHVVSDGPCFDVQIQCELSSTMTLRMLKDCAQQGLEESYRTIKELE